MEFSREHPAHRLATLAKQLVDDGGNLPHPVRLGDIVFHSLATPELLSTFAEIVWQVGVHLGDNTFGVTAGQDDPDGGAVPEMTLRSAPKGLFCYMYRMRETFKPDTACLSLATDGASVNGLKLQNTAFFTAAGECGIAPPQV